MYIYVCIVGGHLGFCVSCDSCLVIRLRNCFSCYVCSWWFRCLAPQMNCSLQAPPSQKTSGDLIVGYGRYAHAVEFAKFFNTF